jgi:hypothetical protein
MKEFFLAIICAIWVVPFAFGQTITYQGVTLEPGDVINFHEGIVTTGHVISYGHSGMYLGMDEKGEHRFLDFNTDNQGRRIPSEREFLNANAEDHPSFEIFRLRDNPKLSPKRLLDAAKVVQRREYELIPEREENEENCSTAVAFVLSQATGRNIHAEDPDDFLGGDFKRHPQLMRKVSICE